MNNQIDMEINKSGGIPEPRAGWWFGLHGFLAVMVFCPSWCFVHRVLSAIVLCPSLCLVRHGVLSVMMFSMWCCFIFRSWKCSIWCCFLPVWWCFPYHVPVLHMFSGIHCCAFCHVATAPLKDAKASEARRAMDPGEHKAQCFTSYSFLSGRSAAHCRACHGWNRHRCPLHTSEPCVHKPGRPLHDLSHNQQGPATKCRHWCIHAML